MVYARQFGSHASTILLKYAVQWLRTARILHRERPDVVFVMTPPLIAALPAFWFAARGGGRVVLDAHSAAFLHPRWRWFQWLQRAMCRKAVTTLVHNEHIARIVRDMGGHATLVPDVPVLFADRRPFPRPSGFVIAVVCSFNYDEPLAAILEAIRRLPDVSFFLTGNPRHFPGPLASALPRNATLTGFLNTALYGGLLTDADAVLALTTRNHTMLRGAYEAIYQGTPTIVSDWPLLRGAFDEGAIHVDNTPDAIVAAIERMRTAHHAYKAGAVRLRERKLRHFERVREEILERIDLVESGPDRTRAPRTHRA